MEKQALLNKIKSLLNLAEDQNSLHEAEAAAKKAQALIMKYNIQEAELHKGQVASMLKSKVEIEQMKKPSEPVWIPNLYSAVAKFNFCEVVRSRTGSGEYAYECLYVLGESHNIDLVCYLSEQLINRLRIIHKKEWKAYDGPEYYEKFKNGFFKGAASGIYMNLKSQQQQFEQVKSTAMIIVEKNEALEKFMSKEFPNIKTGRASRVSSRDGYDKGLKAGRSTKINSGLQTADGKKLLK